MASKFRGSGFLAKPEELDRFLGEIFDRADIDISIKTRIGRDEPEEFERLLEIYNQYPLKELIIHPRGQQDYYTPVSSDLPSSISPLFLLPSLFRNLPAICSII